MPIKEVDNISIHKLLAIISRRKLMIVLPVLLLAVLFAAYAHSLPDRYEARALLAVDAPAGVPNVQVPTVDEQLSAVRENLLGRPLLEKVISEFKLYPSEADPVETIKSQITIDVVNTRAFHVGFQGENPELVARVANRLAELFVSKTASVQTRTVAQANGLLQAQLETLRGKLASENEQIQNYKEKAGDALPERLGTDLKAIEVVGDRVQILNTSIATDLAARSSAMKEMSDLEKQGALEPAVAKDETASQRKLDELKLELAEARTKYTEKTPKVISLAKQVKDLELSQSQTEPAHAEPSAASLRYIQLSAEVSGLDQRLQAQYQDLNTLKAELRADQGQVASVPQHENEMAMLLRDHATTQESYESLLAKQDLASASGEPAGAVASLLFTIAEPARAPLAPFSPRRARIVLMGLFAGLGLGSILAFGAEQLNTSFQDSEQFAAFSSLPVLAEVASISNTNGGHSKAGRVVTVKQPTSVPAEQYFTLAAKVRQRCRGTSPVVLAITSATGGEGKTLTSLNLSVALAKSSGGKVLLIDADLRRPMLHEYLELDDAERKGFGDLLLNTEDDFHNYIFEYNGLSVMPTYKRVANPLGMLNSQSTRALLDRISGEFSFVILDSPPIVPIADGHILANLADHVLLITRARRTPRELFKLAVDSLDCSNVIGIALNDVDTKHSRYASAYRYYQEHYQK